MFDILNDFTTASVDVTCTRDSSTCPNTYNFSMENLSLVRATPLEQNIDSEGEAYSMRFTHFSQDEGKHNIQEKLLDIVVKKSGTDKLGIALVSASLQEMLTSESLLYIGNENEDAYAQERELYVSGLKDSSTSNNDGDGPLVITAKNDASGCTVKVTLKKATADAAAA